MAMYIRIDLKTTLISTYKFPVTLTELEEAVDDGYLGLGTSYAPITVDDFVTLAKSKFPTIHGDTEVAISLEPEDHEKKYKAYDPLILCCKVLNVGKGFNDLPSIPKNPWEIIFDCKNPLLYSAPDNTLYISPDKDNICYIATKKGDYNALISYSILFSLMIGKRRCYFILDPLLKVSSNR